MRALVLANGPLGDAAAIREHLGEIDLVIAADGGARHADTLGVGVGILVGDLDSIQPALLARLRSEGVEVLRFPERKDEIDLELALREASRRGARSAVVLGALGARWDQTLANVLLALSPKIDGLEVTFLEGAQRVRVLLGPGELVIDEAPGTTVSLIPLNDDARGITTFNLEYPLVGESLPFGTPRGVSNVVSAGPARVSLASGALCVVVIRS